MLRPTHFFSYRSLQKVILNHNEALALQIIDNLSDEKLNERVTVTAQNRDDIYKMITPLHAAVIENLPTVVRTLIGRKADVNILDGNEADNGEIGLLPLAYFDPHLLELGDASDKVGLRTDAVNVLKHLIDGGNTEEQVVELFGQEVLDLYKKLSLQTNTNTFSL